MAFAIHWAATPPQIVSRSLNDPRSWSWVGNRSSRELRHPSGLRLVRIGDPETYPDGTVKAHVEVQYIGRVVAVGVVEILNP